MEEKDYKEPILENEEDTEIVNISKETDSNEENSASNEELVNQDKPIQNELRAEKVSDEDVTAVKEMSKSSKETSKASKIIGTVIFLILTIFIAYWIIKRYFLI